MKIRERTVINYINTSRVRVCVCRWISDICQEVTETTCSTFCIFHYFIQQHQHGLASSRNLLSFLFQHFPFIAFVMEKWIFLSENSARWWWRRRWSTVSPGRQHVIMISWKQIVERVSRTKLISCTECMSDRMCRENMTSWSWDNQHANDNHLHHHCSLPGLPPPPAYSEMRRICAMRV